MECPQVFRCLGLGGGIHFHPKSISYKVHAVSSKKITCGTINVVRVSEGVADSHEGPLKVERREFRCSGVQVLRC